jgi:hypothetical protein
MLLTRTVPTEKIISPLFSHHEIRTVDIDKEGVVITDTRHLASVRYQEIYRGTGFRERNKW